MNMNKNPNLTELKRFVSRIDDSAGNHIVWVDLEGNVHASKVARGDSPAEWARRMEGKFRCRLETLIKGNGYLGKKAAMDDQWMRQMLHELGEGWGKGKTDVYTGC